MDPFQVAWAELSGPNLPTNTQRKIDNLQLSDIQRIIENLQEDEALLLCLLKTSINQKKSYSSKKNSKA